MKRILLLLIALASVASASLTHAGSHTWNGAASGYWNNAANWSAGGKPVAGEANVTLLFPVGATRYITTNNIPGLVVTDLTLNGDYWLAGSGGATLTFGGAGATIVINGSHVSTVASSLPIVLNQSVTYYPNHVAARLTIDSTISGAGGLAQYGPGVLVFSGLNANTYAGITQVLRGEMRLSQANLFPALAVPGRFVIGTENLAEPALVRLFENHQIANDNTVVINPGGTLALNGRIDTLGTLQMDGGTLTTDNGADTGELTLGANVIADNGNSYIYGHVSLGGASRTVNTLSSGTLFLYAVTRDGGGFAGLIKTGPGSLFLTATNTYAGATLVQQGILTLALDGEPGATNAGTFVANGASVLLIDCGIGREPLSLSGAGVGGDYGALRAEGDSEWSGAVTFATASTVHVPMINDTFTFSSVLSGDGAFIKTGAGRLWLTGAHTNAHTGGTIVEKGEVVLSVSNHGIPIPGPLVIGNALDAPGSARVWPTASHQIADTAAITVHASGRLSFEEQQDTIGALTLLGGVVDSTTGTWTLGGNIFADNGYSYLRGKLSLGGATRTVNAQNAHLIVEAVISNGGASAGLEKVGPGILQLKAANTYSGLTAVKAGTLYLSASGRPGNSDEGTTVANGASVLLYDHTVDFETLTFVAGPALSGTLASAGNISAWNGSIAVYGEARVSASSVGESLALGGGIIGNPGATLIKTGAGAVRLKGNQDNIYPGPTWVKQGTLLLDKAPGRIAIPGTLTIGDTGTNTVEVRLLGPNQIHDLSALSLTTNGFLNLNNQVETIGSLAGAGRVNLGFASLRAGGNNTDTTYSGAISGVIFAGFTKEGSGRMFLTGTNTYPGKTFVNAGNLFINGQQSSAVAVNPGAFLNGHGKAGAITATNGVVAPGTDGLFGPGLARLHCNGATFNANTGLWLEFAGADAGTNYSQLDVTGPVSLGNSVPKLRMWFSSAVSNEFMIINNDGVDPVVGTFSNLPEGATLTSFNGTQFRISYVGGTGNDVVLTQLTVVAPPELSGITKLGNGQIQLTGTGVLGVTYTVEANFDLGTTDWLNLGEISAQPPAGALQFIDLDAAQYPQRFYRFVAP